MTDNIDILLHNWINDLLEGSDNDSMLSQHIKELRIAHELVKEERKTSLDTYM